MDETQPSLPPVPSPESMPPRDSKAIISEMEKTFGEWRPGEVGFMALGDFIDFSRADEKLSEWRQTIEESSEGKIKPTEEEKIVNESILREYELRYVAVQERVDRRNGELPGYFKTSQQIKGMHRELWKSLRREDEDSPSDFIEAAYKEIYKIWRNGALASE